MSSPIGSSPWVPSSDGAFERSRQIQPCQKGDGKLGSDLLSPGHRGERVARVSVRLGTCCIPRISTAVHVWERTPEDYIHSQSRAIIPGSLLVPARLALYLMLSRVDPRDLLQACYILYTFHPLAFSTLVGFLFVFFPSILPQGRPSVLLSFLSHSSTKPFHMNML
ncbi:hypothetical protein GE09DRAFT_693024 [Coniochaeta sp. 2T2.1]|nr:hypothetical protein GE09DRAFT_693024 [Coniochaeta sp. 2T2.1]